MEYPYITDEQVKKTLLPLECISAVEEGFRLDAGQRAGDRYMQLAYGLEGASLHLYAAYVPGYGLSAKILGAYPENPRKGLPYIYAQIIVLDPVTGVTQALLDGRYLTAFRTAAASALSIKYLARHDSTVLGILGTGLQAETHLRCCCAIHRFKKVLVYGRTQSHLQAFSTKVQPETNIEITPVSDPNTVLGEADVVACVTSSEVPLFEADWVRPGTHLITIAPFTATKSEVPYPLHGNSDLYVDAEAKFQSSWGNDMPPRVKGELGKVVVGDIPGRLNNKSISLFHSLGMAFEDIVTARLVLDRIFR